MIILYKVHFFFFRYFLWVDELLKASISKAGVPFCISARSETCEVTLKFEDRKMEEVVVSEKPRQGHIHYGNMVSFPKLAYTGPAVTERMPSPRACLSWIALVLHRQSSLYRISINDSIVKFPEPDIACFKSIVVLRKGKGEIQISLALWKNGNSNRVTVSTFTGRERCYCPEPTLVPHVLLGLANGKSALQLRLGQQTKQTWNRTGEWQSNTLSNDKELVVVIVLRSSDDEPLDGSRFESIDLWKDRVYRCAAAASDKLFRALKTANAKESDQDRVQRVHGKAAQVGALVQSIVERSKQPSLFAGLLEQMALATESTSQCVERNIKSIIN